MIKLLLFSSNKKYLYKTKKRALREIKDNGLKSYEYILTDEEKDTIYKNGLWLNNNEYSMLQNGYNIKNIRKLRKLNK